MFHALNKNPNKKGASLCGVLSSNVAVLNRVAVHNPNTKMVADCCTRLAVVANHSNVTYIFVVATCRQQREIRWPNIIPATMLPTESSYREMQYPKALIQNKISMYFAHIHMTPRSIFRKPHLSAYHRRGSQRYKGRSLNPSCTSATFRHTVVINSTP